MDRHITVSGFVVHEGRVALHWHRKLGAWLPAGGHIEENEDPVHAVLREIKEEFALDAELLPLGRRLPYTGGPAQMETPVALLDCWPAPDHGHVDMVYYARAVSGYPGVSHDPDNPIVWLTEEELATGAAAHNGETVAFPPDVQALAIDAIRQAALLTVPQR